MPQYRVDLETPENEPQHSVSFDAQNLDEVFQRVEILFAAKNIPVAQVRAITEVKVIETNPQTGLNRISYELVWGDNPTIT